VDTLRLASSRFDNVQQILTSQKMAGDRTRKHQGHYLVGTVYCGLCGKRLMYTKCTGRHGRKFEKETLRKARRTVGPKAALSPRRS
jgi:hypothetical protein